MGTIRANTSTRLEIDALHDLLRDALGPAYTWIVEVGGSVSLRPAEDELDVFLVRESV